MALTTQPPEAKYAFNLFSGSAPLVHGVEKASSTYVRGAFLIDDDAGRITESTTAIDASAVTHRTLGMAIASATGTTGANVDIVWASNFTVFEITLSNLSVGTNTLAQANQWQIYAITKGSANWYLDANAQSDAGGGLVIGFKDPIGTVDGRVYMIVTAAARGGTNASSAAW